MRSNSWVIRNKTTKEAIIETFDKRLVDILNTDKYEAIPAYDYLVEINAEIKKGKYTPDIRDYFHNQPETNTMKTETYLLPDYFAPYLINGDDSALENNELLAIDSFLAERNVTAGECMDAVDAGFHKWNELGAMARLEGNCMEYTFPVIKGAKGVF